MFSRTLPLADLIHFCRNVRVELDAGVSPVKILRQQARRGPRTARDLCGRLAVRVENGQSLAEALRGETALPALFEALARVGEHTGYLPEVLASLERYYELQLSLRKQFRARIAAPVFQFVIALFLIALVIWLMGILPGFRDNDITLFGLAGPSGAGIFLGVVFGTIAGVLVGWWVLSRTLRGRAAAAVRTILVNHLRDEILQLVCPAQAEPVGT